MALARETGTTLHPWVSRDTEAMQTIIEEYLENKKENAKPKHPAPIKKKRNLKDLADTVGISLVWLSRIINGHARPSWPVAEKLAEETESDPTHWMKQDMAMIHLAVETYQYGRPITWESTQEGSTSE